jgi:anthranilate/para-aminobenzoate synthase component I
MESAPSIIPLPRKPDLDRLFAEPAPGAALFDGWSDEGRWQIALPWPARVRELSWREPERWNLLIRELEGDRCGVIPSLPFAGGWVGFISYEAGATREDVLPRDTHPPEPAAFFSKHERGILIDPHGRAYLFAPAGEAESCLRALESPATARAPRGSLRELSDSLPGEEYHARVSMIREMIRRGDVYQVNLTRALSARGTLAPLDLFRALTLGSPQSSAVIFGGAWSIVSASPEVLLTYDAGAGIAESRPIKGTVRRNGDDAAEIAALLGSEKDAGEHLMIVDVVRNDLGKVAPTGCVTVPEFRAVRTLRYVHHLESTVRATNLGGRSLSEILEALLPAASITGAPKRAVVRTIREIEPVPRGVYCGSIGMITAAGARFSVAIRTAIASGDVVRYHTGGGIVWDSDAEAEDDECRAKAEPFLRLVR